VATSFLFRLIVSSLKLVLANLSFSLASAAFLAASACLADSFILNVANLSSAILS